VPGNSLHCYKLVTPLNSYDKSHAMGKPMQGTGQNGHTVILPLPAGTRQTCMLNTQWMYTCTLNDFYLLEYTVPTITTHTFPAYLTCKLQLSEPTVTADRPFQKENRILPASRGHAEPSPFRFCRLACQTTKDSGRKTAASPARLVVARVNCCATAIRILQYSNTPHDHTERQQSVPRNHHHASHHTSQRV
jgi:hypothetical protein